MSKVNLHALIGNAYRPKHAIGRDTGVEVMDLICRGNLSLIEVESNKTEGASVLLSVHPNVDALHETHVHIEEEGLPLTTARVDARSRTPNVSSTNEALEVEDRRIFGARSGRCRIKVKKLAKGLEAFGNGFWSGTITLCQR